MIQCAMDGRPVYTPPVLKLSASAEKSQEYVAPCGPQRSAVLGNAVGPSVIGPLREGRVGGGGEGFRMPPWTQKFRLPA